MGEMASRIHFEEVLDVGCGEGVSLTYMQRTFTPGFITGFDLDGSRVKQAKSGDPAGRYFISNAQDVPLPGNSVDLVICLEALEHVGEPKLVLREISRVSRKYALFSVPNEPWWRLGNMIRGKYLSMFGNTPGHINHWSLKQFLGLLEDGFEVLLVRQPVLWNFVLARKRIASQNDGGALR